MRVEIEGMACNRSMSSTVSRARGIYYLHANSSQGVKSVGKKDAHVLQNESA